VARVCDLVGVFECYLFCVAEEWVLCVVVECFKFFCRDGEFVVYGSIGVLLEFVVVPSGDVTVE